MAYFILSLTLLTVGFGLGVLAERIAWNRLIEKGILPKPGQKNMEKFCEGEDCDVLPSIRDFNKTDDF